MAKQRYAVGIDLGTTFSSLAYVDEEGRVEPLRLPDGTFQVASIVYFKSLKEIVVGSDALPFASMDASRVARAFKRHMGEKDFQFEVDGKSFRPEQLSAMILKKLLEAAVQKLGPIDNVVISVPFVFDESRRQATQSAGKIAGIKSIDIVDEPVAAALAYGHTLMQGGSFSLESNEVYADETVLVYDLGGGTFDATVMTLASDGNFEVVATDGDERLGGEDWDNALLELVCHGYQRETGSDPRQERELMQELRLKTVEAKKTLSERAKADIAFTHKGCHYAFHVARGEFEKKTEALLARTEFTLGEMLKRKELSWSHIDKVLMVGGSSRMPMVRKMLERTTKRYLDMSLPPDIAIAKGAALFSAYRSGSKGLRVKQIKTVNSHPLGLMVKSPKTNKLVNDVVLKANEPTLTRAKRSYKIRPGAKSLVLAILLGDSPDPEACVSLGKARIPHLPSNLEKVEVSFCFQENGLLSVQALGHRSGGLPPLKSGFEVAVEGKMSETEVEDATNSLRGISID